jgi:diguanylate cyclase (GGDEF)-like protein
MGFAMAALLLLYAAWQLSGWSPVDRTTIGDMFFYPVSLAATWTAWRAAGRCRGSARTRRAWLLFALAAFAYLLGDVAQTVYETLGIDSYPAPSDAFYLAFYPLMLAGIFAFPVRRRTTGERVRTAVDLAVVALGGGAAVVYVVLGPTALRQAASVGEALCSIAYPVGDMVLLVGLGSLLLHGSPPSSRRALQLVGVGLGFYVLADLVYGYVQLHATYRGGDPVDSLWMIAIAVMAVGATFQRAVDAPELLEARRERISWLPYTAVWLGFGVLLFSDRHDPLFPGLTMTMIAMALVGLVSIRQYLGQRDLLGAQDQLRYQALHDTLTGLPNRLLFIDRAQQLLNRAQRTGRGVGLLFVDLDGFKHVNDTCGHAAGDMLLQVVAERLQRLVRSGDTVARLGGDEFVVLLDPEPFARTPELLAERILWALRRPVELDCALRAITVTASIGIAAGARKSAEELLRDADIALYRAKEAGRDRFVCFESRMYAAVEDRLWLEMDLIDAIENGQLVLEYQPTFDLRSEEVAGAEALVRWNHPTRGLVAPSYFVPIAEETGVIVALGRWVLQEACRQAAEWHRDGHPLRVAVNVSGRQLDEPGLADDVRDALALVGLPAEALTLEITETALTRDPELAAERLRELKALGVRIAVDDFGTGYSSLGYLKQFPVDTLKIDRVFVSGLGASSESAALVRTVVQLAKWLDLETVGEGIETAAQLQHLRDEECELGQGFLLAAPMSAAALEQLLERRVSRVLAHCDR